MDDCVNADKNGFAPVIADCHKLVTYIVQYILCNYVSYYAVQASLRVFQFTIDM